MGMPSSSKRWVSAAVAMSLIAVPAIASVASVSAPPITAPPVLMTENISPLVALSFLASDSSRAALCGVAGANAATNVAASTVADAHAVVSSPPTIVGAESGTAAPIEPAKGCVLPLIDQPVAVSEVAPLGLGILPLLSLLAGPAAIAAGLAASGSGQPISPA